LVDQIDLLKVGLILNGYIYGLNVKMYYLINGHTEISRKAFQFINSNITGIVLHLIVAGIGYIHFVSSPKNWTFEIWENLVKFKLGIDEKDNIYRKSNYRDFEIS